MSLPVDPAPLNLELLRVGAAILQCIREQAANLGPAALQAIGAATLAYRGGAILKRVLQVNTPEGGLLKVLGVLALNLTHPPGAGQDANKKEGKP